MNLKRYGKNQRRDLDNVELVGILLPGIVTELCTVDDVFVIKLLFVKSTAYWNLQIDHLFFSKPYNCIYNLDKTIARKGHDSH